MLAMVTGAAGFIGSTLVDRLLREGWAVRGVDAFTDYYDVAQKRANLAGALADARFELVEDDLLAADLAALLDGVEVVFHQAAQPGVRLSWADGFQRYVELNVSLTQRLLEAVRSSGVRRLVYASSSSVYGNAPRWPTTEDDPTKPFSPYGVTKLAAEHLCAAYAANFGVSTVSLRYFTVYGPRQRPDMATHRLVEAALGQTPFPLYGDGSQVRDFTFVDDVVDANVRAATADVPPGTVLNVAGGGSTRLLDLVHLAGDLAGAPVPIDWRPAEAGDVERTGGSTDRAADLLGWRPAVGIEEGVRRQVAWHVERRRGAAGGS